MNTQKRNRANRAFTLIELLVVLTIVAVLTAIMLSTFYGPKGPSLPVSDGQPYSVTLLFEHDGVKVYRFMDLGSYRYYAEDTEARRPARAVSSQPLTPEEK